jgi:hypothetical protein
VPNWLVGWLVSVLPSSSLWRCPESLVLVTTAGHNCCLLLLTTCLPAEPEVDDSDLSLNRVLKFENDMDAQAAHEARLEVKVEMIDEDYQTKNRS